MRANKSKFRKGQAVVIRDWTGKKTEHGVISAVSAIPVRTSASEQFTMYRYMVAMDNARGVFGKSQRFVFEYEIVQAVVVSGKKAA